jgi:hypothetical protein
MSRSAAEFVKAYHESLAFVTDKKGAASGFIALIGKANFLITNVHVAAEISDAPFKTLDDVAIQTGAPSIAVGRDIFAMASPAGGKPLEVMENVDANAAIGDDVLVLGNAEGAGVINTILGKIRGIGPDRVEVDAPFVPGNSGSPIIHLKTGKVIGVATYLSVTDYDPVTLKKVANPVIRRFGYRLDNIKAWQSVDLRAFNAQAAEMKKIEDLTADLDDLFTEMGEHNGRITPGRHTNPAIKDRIDQWIAQSSGNGLGRRDQKLVDVNFLSYLSSVCESDVTAARQRISYNYFQRELAEQQEIRDDMSKAFEGIKKNVGF